MKKQLRGCFLIVLTSLTVLQACQEETYEPLPRDVMRDILSEIHLADAVAERYEAKLEPRNVLREDVYDQILERYDLSRESFFDSYKWYLEETYILDSLYQYIIDSLNTQVQELEELSRMRKNRNVPDKIKNMGDSLREEASKNKSENVRPAWESKPADAKQ